MGRPKKGGQITAAAATTIALMDLKIPANLIRTIIEDTEIHSLAGSIKEIGLITPPTIRMEEGKPVLVAGYRRYLAMVHLGWQNMPVVIMGGAAAKGDAVMLHENLYRADISPLDESRWVRDLMKASGLTQDLIARRLKKSAGWVSERLAIAEWPELLRNAIKTGGLPLGVAREFARCDDVNQLAVWIESAVEAGCSVRTAKYWLELWKNQQTQLSVCASAEIEPEYIPPVDDGLVVCEFCGERLRYEKTKFVRGCKDCIAAARENLANQDGE